MPVENVFRLSLSLDAKGTRGPEYDLFIFSLPVQKETNALYMVADGVRSRQVRKDAIGVIAQEWGNVWAIDLRSYATGENLEEVIAAMKERINAEVWERVKLAQTMGQLSDVGPARVMVDENDRYSTRSL